jgi:hypothetical protein
MRREWMWRIKMWLGKAVDEFYKGKLLSTLDSRIYIPDDVRGYCEWNLNWNFATGVDDSCLEKVTIFWTGLG